MAEYVKICPQCQHINPESDNTCEQCATFIGLEEAILMADALAKIGSAPQRSRSPDKTHVLYLEASGGTPTFTIYHNTVLGQHHKSNTADVQIEGITGSQFIHRQHCRFEYDNGQWYITALDQRQFGHKFTNPTFINEKKIPTEQRTELHHGYRLTLSGILFRIKIVNP